MGVSSVRYTTSGSLAYSTVIYEINGSRAIYATFRSSNSGHTLAIIGYNDYANIYYVHNPWYNYTETITIGGNYVGGGKTYSWSGGSVYLV